ncbi:sensor histidine kinase [Viridibacterium curvum]|uniref:histidine kinase n=1 Tax=Viridibacterium curvum TaxID=1101404 RepID=A0ABP9QI63_9RHOO
MRNRNIRRLVVLTTLLGAVLLLLLAFAGANTTAFAENYPLLLGANGLVALALFILVSVQLRTLWQEYRQRQFGSRLKLKLIGMFVLLSVLPGSIIYFVSVQFAVQSVESWYNVKVDTALENGLSLGRSALDALLDQLAERTRSAALDLGESGQTPSLPALTRLRSNLDVANISVLSSSGRVMVSAGEEMRLQVESPEPAQLRQARQTQGWRAVESDGREGLILRVVVPIPSRHYITDSLLLQVMQPVPESLASSAEGIQTLHQEYQELLLARQGLKQIYIITLTLGLLLAVFAAVAIAFVFARSLSAPLSIIAEGTQAVASGDFSPRQALPARDELGVLTQSFNRMTRQLLEARALAEKNSAAVSAARAYLESVLTNLSAGVLAFSADGRLRAANRGALTSLRDDLETVADIPLTDWPVHTTFRDAVLTGFAEREGDWQQQIDIDHGGGEVQTLLLHGSRLPADGGFVVVFDDITQLISGQRNAAWAEVARRLAHEIKNPLTPIQLAAERLEMRLAEQLDDKGRDMLTRATHTIVNQVEAMKTLVNSFRDYARLPPPTLASVDLNELVRDVLVLYENTPQRIRIQLGDGLPLVRADASQLRQVIHNLLQNAQQALGDKPDAAIHLTTRHDGRRVELQLRDNGPGFPQAMLSRAFEPYVTTKPKGTGLGLAIVKKIIDEHRGEISLGNATEGGAEVCIRLAPA